MSIKAENIARAFDITIDDNQFRLYVGEVDTASVGITLVRGALTGLDIDIYSSADGVTVPTGKGALATISDTVMMTADFSTKGFPWLIGIVTNVGTVSASLADIYAFGKRNTA